MWSRYVEEMSKQVSFNFIPYLHQHPNHHFCCLEVDKYEISYVNVLSVKRFPVSVHMYLAVRVRVHNNDDSNVSDGDIHSSNLPV